MVLAEHNNRLPPVADKRRVLWRRGQRKFALQAFIFFGHRKSRECSPKIRDFRASGIPIGERVEKIDTLTASPKREGCFSANKRLKVCGMLFGSVRRALPNNKQRSVFNADRCGLARKFIAYA